MTTVIPTVRLCDGWILSFFWVIYRVGFYQDLKYFDRARLLSIRVSANMTTSKARIRRRFAPLPILEGHGYTPMDPREVVGISVE